MHITHFEAGAFAVQTAGSEGRQSAFVSKLRKRVGLIHHLRQLAAAEEKVDGAADTLGIHQLGDAAQLVGVLEAHALLHRATQLQESLAEFLSCQLIDGAQATIAQMIDIVDITFAAAQLEHVFQRVDQILAAQGHHVFRNRLVEFAVNAEPTNAA